MDEVKPKFKHDCEHCVFVGRVLTAGHETDLYLACDKSAYTYIIRYDNEPSKYISGITDESLKEYLAPRTGLVTLHDADKGGTK